MRTTLNIEDEALAYAKERARASGKSLGAVVTEALVESSQPKEAEFGQSKAGFPVVRNTNRGKKITMEQIQAALDEEDVEKYRASLRR